VPNEHPTRGFPRTGHRQLTALPQIGAAAREALGVPDLDRALSAALATIDQLKSPSRVIELNPAAGQPDIPFKGGPMVKVRRKTVDAGSQDLPLPL